MYEYYVTVSRIIDGDTIEGYVDVGFGFGFWAKRGQAIKGIRLLGVDTPELNTPEGVAARDRVVELLTGNTVFCRTIRMPTTDNFARYLADVILPDGSSLVATLINEGHVKV